MQKTQVKVDFSYQAVLNCFLRETADWSRLPLEHEACPEEFREAGLDSFALIPLTGEREIAVGIRYHSLTLRHQLQFPVLTRARGEAWHRMDLADFVEQSLRSTAEKLNVKRRPEPELLIRKIQNSAANIERFIEARSADITALNSAAPQSFIESEQSLLIGHQTHPVGKTREGFDDAEMELYSPELQGRFALHFFRVHPSVLHSDSAVPGRSTDQILRDMIAQDPAVSAEFRERCDEKRDWALLPVHPWQARYVREHVPEVRELFAQGLLEDLGPAGSEFTPTTSIRTVYREGFEFMFKFSLNVKITNSVRVSLARELDRSVEMARLMSTDYGRTIQADVPEFVFIQDPAYVAVKWNGKVIEPLSCTLRDAATVNGVQDISAVAALVQDHPRGGVPRLGSIIEGIAARESRDVEAVSLDWYRAYLSVSIYNLLKLFFKWGLCFEAHGQNSLLELKNGYPVRYFYRDSQGYFHRAAAHEDFTKVIPRLGEVTESIFPEDLANERLVYYLIVNQVFSIINALGTQGLADEHELMREFDVMLDRVAEDGARYPTTMIDQLKNLERLPCKGNLLTQLFDMDELVGDIATQSVYVTIPNIVRQGGVG